MDNQVEREKTNVPLNARSRAFIEELREQTGVPKVEALARIIEWVAEFDHKAIMAILYRDEDKKRELARSVLMEMAGIDKLALPYAAEELDAEQAAAAAHALIDRLLITQRIEAAEAKMQKVERKPKSKGT